MNIENNEVYTFKLTSGEEMVAKVISQTENSIELDEPVSIAPGAQGMGLVPSLFTAEKDKNVTLNKNTVAMFCITADQVRVKYIEATTGITTASKKIVMG